MDPRPITLCLLICATLAHCRDLRPSQHGVEQETNPGAASPAMIAFFGGRPVAELPEASEAIDPVWTSRVAPDRTGGRGHARVALLAVGIVCVVVGVILLAAAAVGFVVHARRSKLGTGSGLGFPVGRRSSSPEVRLGGA